MSSSKSFFKVILHCNVHDHRLRIPDIFVENYGDELSDLVRLIVPTGDIWCVGVEKSEKTIWLQDGLQTFMEGHSVRFGSLLVFDYGGNSVFNIRIFNSTAMEIQYPSRSESARPDDVNQLPIFDQEVDDDSHHDNSGDEVDDDSSIVCLGSSADHQLQGEMVETSEFVSGNKQTNVTSAKRWKVNRYYLTRSKKQKIQDEGGNETTGILDFSTPRVDRVYHSNGSMHKTNAHKAALVSSKKTNRRITSNTNEKNSSEKHKSVCGKTSPQVYSKNRPVEVQVKQATEATNMSLPENPLYEITLKRYNLKKYIVNIPIEFARSYLSNTSKFIKIQDADDNEWKVHCNVSQQKSCHLTKGWKNIVQEKNLMVGDVCIFEPSRINEEVKLKLKICRTVE